MPKPLRFQTVVRASQTARFSGNGADRTCASTSAAPSSIRWKLSSPIASCTEKPTADPIPHRQDARCIDAGGQGLVDIRGDCVRVLVAAHPLADDRAVEQGFL